MSFERIGVVGGGAWGTALAQVAASGGRDVLLWAREPEVVEAVNSRHENPMFLPDRSLDPAIRATDRLSDLADCGAWLMVTPAQHMRSVLSGPTFAHEVAAGLPTAVTLAAEDGDLGEQLRDRIARPTFRVYLSDDVAGAEIGGAVKNVLAIACGVVEGAGLGQNARAALIARGFAEMTRFGLANGARRETLAGLSGLGDLVLTCSSTSSRNFSLGKGIGEGRSAAELMADRKTVAEGAFTAPVLAQLAASKGIDMTIVAAVAKLLSGAANVRDVLEELLARPPRPEAH